MLNIYYFPSRKTQVENFHQERRFLPATR